MIQQGASRLSGAGTASGRRSGQRKEALMAIMMLMEWDGIGVEEYEKARKHVNW